MGRLRGPPFARLAAAIRTLLGLTCARLSEAYPQNALMMVKSTGAAAALWIVGVGTRLAFGLYAEHGGAGTISRFDAWAHVSGFATRTSFTGFAAL